MASMSRAAGLSDHDGDTSRAARPESVHSWFTVRSYRLASALAVAALASMWLASKASQAAQSPDTLTLRIIVAGSGDEAQRLVDRVSKGEDFAVLARAESIDPSADRGGLLGRIALSTLRPELRNVLRGAGPGQLTPVVQVPTGFAFFKVEEDVDSTDRPPANPVGAPPALAATGSVKYVIDVGGLPEAEAVLRDFPKRVTWNQDPRTICQARRDSLASAR